MKKRKTRPRDARTNRVHGTKRTMTQFFFFGGGGSVHFRTWYFSCSFKRGKLWEVNRAGRVPPVELTARYVGEWLAFPRQGLSSSQQKYMTFNQVSRCWINRASFYILLKLMKRSWRVPLFRPSLPVGTSVGLWGQNDQVFNGKNWWRTAHSNET